MRGSLYTYSPLTTILIICTTRIETSAVCAEDTAEVPLKHLHRYTAYVSRQRSPQQYGSCRSKLDSHVEGLAPSDTM
jgi:hypothetical protein